jgi:hypothetical protein
MSDQEPHAHAKGTKIKWGAVLAGAAVVAGALLFAPVIGNMMPTVTATAATGGAATAATGAAAGAAAPGTMANLVQAAIDGIKNLSGKLFSETGKRVAGAALIGGGAAYFISGEEPATTPHQELASRNRESFAMTEDMRLAQGKMIIQAASAGNEQAQAMLAQSAGRG